MPCWLWGAALLASVPAARAADCSRPVDSAACLECALAHDPRIAAAESDLREAEALARSAGLWDNPELDVEALRASSGGAGGSLTAGIRQTLPLSGSRRWAGKAAGRRAEASRARLRQVRWEVSAETVLRLVRLRQIGDEVRLVEQGRALCGQALDRFGKLAFLTDEQEAARRAFEWSRVALMVRAQGLRSESEDLRDALTASLGGAAPAVWDFLVSMPAAWPEWPAAVGPVPAVAAARAEAEAARAEWRRARTAAWPDLSIGPLVEAGSGSPASWGAGLGLALPLFNRKRGDVARAAAGVDRAGVALSVAEGAAARRRDLLARRYVETVARMQEAGPAVRGGAGELEEFQARYLAGRIPASLVLEVLSRYQEAVDGVHALERDAWSALWEGYALQGLDVVPRLAAAEKERS
ncbi:MAG: TolC family protein [Candidatus Coatesbacteria bacterium]